MELATNAHYLDRTNNATSFAGSDVDIFALCVISSALNSYAKHKLIMNRAYTPTSMLAAAARYTGKTYKRGQYAQAASDLAALADKLKTLPRTP
jgi:hypothetical protein